MASNRHLGRIVALQTLYENDFRKESNDSSLESDKVLNRNIERYQETIEDKAFIKSLVEGVLGGIEKLDALIVPIAPEWPIEQIARIDRNILRMALWELHHGQNVPPKVVINEAVELAKAFGGDNSSKFVNGVLGTAYRNIEEAQEKTAKKATKKPTSKKATGKDAEKSSKKTTK